MRERLGLVPSEPAQIEDNDAEAPDVAARDGEEAAPAPAPAAAAASFKFGFAINAKVVPAAFSPLPPPPPKQNNMHPLLSFQLYPRRMLMKPAYIQYITARPSAGRSVAMCP